MYCTFKNIGRYSNNINLDEPSRSQLRYEHHCAVSMHISIRNHLNRLHLIPSLILHDLDGFLHSPLWLLPSIHRVESNTRTLSITN